MVSTGIRRHPLSLAHDRLALVLALCVPFSAVPLASNRATWWLLWTMLFALLAIYHLLRGAGLERGYKPGFLRFRLGFILALLLPVWALMQTLPLGDFLPDGWLGTGAGISELAGPRVSIQPDVAMVGILRFMGYILLLALVIEVSSREQRVLRLATTVFAGVVAQAVWAIIALNFLDDFSFAGAKTAYEGVATGSFVNRNSLATFLGFGAILGIGILVERTNQFQIRASQPPSLVAQTGSTSAFVVLGIALQLAALLETQSRLGLASTVIAMIATILLVRRRAGTPIFRLIGELLFFLVIAGMGVVVLAGGDGVMSRFLFSSNEGQTRLALYSQILGMIAQRPLTGFGMDSFGFAFEAFRAPPLLGVGSFDLAHNSYLMLWAEFGVVIGSIPPLLLVASAVVLRQRMKATAGYPGLALAGIGVLVLGAVHSLGDFSLEIPANVYLFVTIIGLGLGLRRQRKPSKHVDIQF
jgi:O-antigen ligase